MKVKKWVPALAAVLVLAAILCLNVFADKGFSDVGSKDYYYDPVAWALQENVTQGTSDTTFSPDAVCSRGQIVTFLWRAFGKPEPAAASNPFSDVTKSSYFYDAVLWAADQKITLGTSATAFSPELACTRGQIVTFLWRALGEPLPEKTQNPFKDVKESDYYFTAVLWAIENNVTRGVTDTAFGPMQNCTRAQTVTFLYRARDSIAAKSSAAPAADPAAAETPAAPSTPSAPSGSGSSTTVVIPGTSEPTQPSTPTDPTEPSTPTDPAEPSTPSDPTEPSTPSDPTEPWIPTEPTEPSGPSAEEPPSHQEDPNAGTWIP